LTEILSENSPVKNVKVLKKSLINLSPTIVYPPNGFRFHILSNVTPKILAIFGDFILLRRRKSKFEVVKCNKNCNWQIIQWHFAIFQLAKSSFFILHSKEYLFIKFLNNGFIISWIC